MSEPGSQNQPDEATVDLLIKQVTEGLSPDEQRALDALDGAVASVQLRDFERAAAAVALAGNPRPQPLPAALAERLARQGAEHFAAAAAAGTGRHVVDLAAARRAAETQAAASPPPRPSRSGAYGWFAAAACLVLAVLAWNRPPPPAAPIAAGAVPPVVVTAPPAVLPPTPAQERAALLTKAGSLRITLGATKDPAAAGVTADVVWDPATQRGFAHFVGLAPNDPALRQYQLWIFDGSRDKRYPVDGGVFDIPAAATEAVIPIHAALPVTEAKAFAVTVEKPGGVVVSGLKHVVALGAAS